MIQVLAQIPEATKPTFTKEKARAQHLFKTNGFSQAFYFPLKHKSQSFFWLIKWAFFKGIQSAGKETHLKCNKCPKSIQIQWSWERMRCHKKNEIIGTLRLNESSQLNCHLPSTVSNRKSSPTRVFAPSSRCSKGNSQVQKAIDKTG